MKNPKTPSIWTTKGKQNLKRKTMTHICIAASIVIIASLISFHFVIGEYPELSIIPILIGIAALLIIRKEIIQLYFWLKIRNKPQKIENPSKWKLAKINGHYARFLTEINGVQYWLSINSYEEATLKKASRQAKAKTANLGNHIIWKYILKNFDKLKYDFNLQSCDKYLIAQPKDNKMVNYASPYSGTTNYIWPNKKAYALYFFEIT